MVRWCGDMLPDDVFRVALRQVIERRAGVA